MNINFNILMIFSFYEILFVLICLLMVLLIYQTVKKKNIEDTLYYAIKKIENNKKTNIIMIVDTFDERFYSNETIKKVDDHIVDINDGKKFMELIHDIQINRYHKDLSIIIYSTGGSITDSDIIMTLLLDYKEDVDMYVPLYAFSAGTMLALCGKRIYVNKYSLNDNYEKNIIFNSISNRRCRGVCIIKVFYGIIAKKSY